MRRALLASAALAACSGGGNKGPDAANVFFTGEVVDWDSTDTNFCGVFMATMTLHANAMNFNETNPNGRFQLTIPGDPTTQVDLTPPTGGSQCLTGMPTYSIPGIVIANAAVIASPQSLYSVRMLTQARATSFYSSFGATLDTTKAQLFVHIDGTPRAVSITGTAGPAQAFDGSVWAAGSSGINVVFPNVDVGNGTTNVSLTGSAIGTGAAPLVAGTFTYLTVIAN